MLFAGETRAFYCNRRFIAPSVNDVHPLVLFARASSTPEELQAKITAAGITHIFLNLGEAARLDKNYKLFQWDEASLRVFNAFDNTVTLSFLFRNLLNSQNTALILRVQISHLF